MSIPEHVLPASPPDRPRPIVIACPETLDLVPVGVRAATVDELRGTHVLRSCPSCQGEHAWSREDAVISS